MAGGRIPTHSVTVRSDFDGVAAVVGVGRHLLRLVLDNTTQTLTLIGEDSVVGLLLNVCIVMLALFLDGRSILVLEVIFFVLVLVGAVAVPISITSIHG